MTYRRDEGSGILIFMWRANTSWVLVAAALTVGACGDTGSPRRLANDAERAPSTTSGAIETEYAPVPDRTPESDWPKCRDVWVDGAALPADYTGCVAIDDWRDEKGDSIPSRSMDSLLILGDGVHCEDGGFLARGWFSDGHVYTPSGTTVVGRLTIYFARLGGTIRSDVYAPNSKEDTAFEAAVAECRR